MEDKKFNLFWRIAAVSLILWSFTPALLGKSEVWNHLILIPTWTFVAWYFYQLYRDWKVSKKNQ